MRLTESRAVRLTCPDKGQAFEWCSEIRGFGVRATPGAKAWIVQLREGGESRRLTLGRVGVLPFEGPAHAPGARDLAIAALNAARRGDDPKIAIGQRRKPGGLTLDDIWQEYERAGFPKLRVTGRKRETTIKRDRDRYGRVLKPELGKEVISAIDTARVRRWLDGIPTDGQRLHSLVMLKSLLSYAASRGLAEVKPINIKAGKSREMQNFYRADEPRKLDDALVSLIATKVSQILPFSALRLLIATGTRLSEITTLKWEAVDLKRGELHLERDKTSENRRTILLTAAAVAVLKALPRTNSGFVFPADSASGHIMDLHKAFRAALAKAELRRLRLHDIRHSFASAAIRQGVSLYTVGKLLGHRQATTTQRYAHREADAAREALDKVAAAIGSGK